MHNALEYSVRFWFMAMVVGQVAFVYYIVAFYGGALAHGTPEVWNKVLPHGYVAGDVTGNLTLAAHLFVAAIVTLSGLLQLVPKILHHFDRAGANGTGASEENDFLHQQLRGLHDHVPQVQVHERRIKKQTVHQVEDSANAGKKPS